MVGRFTGIREPCYIDFRVALKGGNRERVWWVMGGDGGDDGICYFAIFYHVQETGPLSL